MAEQKIILGKYVILEENDFWTCRSCQHRSNGRPYRMIAHLTRNPGKGIKICPRITAEEVEELKRDLGLGPDSTDADGQQPQQPGENDDIRQGNGNKKRKGASGSGASGSNPREAEMSLIGASNPSGALGKSISVSDGRRHGLQNLAKSVEATGLQPDSPEQNSSFSDFAPLWPEVMPATAETSQDRERVHVPNTDDGGFRGTNAVGSPQLINNIHQLQSSSSQGQVDHRNDQHTYPCTSTHKNASGVEIAGDFVSADEPPPPCPPGFNPDLWKFYLEIDEKEEYLWSRGKFPSYDCCMLLTTDEEERKVLLGLLESSCSEVRDYLTRDPYCGKERLQLELHLNFFGRILLCRQKHLSGQVSRVEEVEKEIRGETAGEIEMLLGKRNNDKNRWVGCAASFKSDVGDLNVAARNVRSLPLQEILQLLSRADELKKIGDVVIGTGLCLLHPVPKDILSWNPTYMSCGSQLVSQNRMPPGQFTPRV